MYLYRKQPYPPSTHVEQQIYGGFFAKPDEQLMNDFHEAEWPKRPAIVEKFQDQRLKKIGLQLIHFERPDLLNDDTRHELDLILARRLMGVGDNIPWPGEVAACLGPTGQPCTTGDSRTVKINKITTGFVIQTKDQSHT
jgi:hypothetical protein